MTTNTPSVILEGAAEVGEEQLQASDASVLATSMLNDLETQLMAVCV
jgi:hypothetical protein